MTSPRYGIFSVDPYGPSAANVALGVADNLAKLRGMNGLNTERELANQKTMATQPGAISFENFLNSFKQQSLPEAFKSSQDEAASKLLNDEASRQEMAARAKLYGPQANLMNAQAGAAVQKSPLDFIRELQGVLKNSDPNSPEYQYANYQLGSILSGLGASPEQFGMNVSEGKPVSNGNMSVAPVSADGLIVNPFTKSSRSLRGAQYAQKNPDSTTTIYNSPTTPVITSIENRQIAEQEAKTLDNAMQQGMAPYWKPTGSFAVIKDQFLARQGDKAAEKRLIDMEAAMRLMRENAANRLREAGVTNIGEEALNSQVKQMYPGLPWSALMGLGTPEINIGASQKAGQTLSQGIQNVSQTAANNFPLQSQGVPVWAQNQPRALSYTDLIKGVQPQARPPQSPQQSQQSNSLVPITGPDGSVYNIPADQVEAALAAGGKRG